jgi:hypothetical protein
MQQHCKHSPGNTTRALPCTMMTNRSEGPPLLKMYWPYSYVLNCMQHMTSRISFALNEANTPNEAMVFSFWSFFACSSSDSSSCAAGLRLVSPPHVFINKVPRRALAPRGAAPVVLDRCRFQTKQKYTIRHRKVKCTSKKVLHFNCLHNAMPPKQQTSFLLPLNPVFW